MTYTSTFLGDNMYQIDTIFNNEPTSFLVVVAKDASELDGLVQFRLDSMANPTPIQNSSVTDITIESLQTQVTALQTQITALTAKA
jgi:hypothetical protein